MSSTPIAQLDDLLESLWNLEDVHRELVQNVNRLVAYLENAQQMPPL